MAWMRHWCGKLGMSITKFNQSMALDYNAKIS